jgi:hypothetical protein
VSFLAKLGDLFTDSAARDWHAISALHTKAEAAFQGSKAATADLEDDAGAVVYACQEAREFEFSEALVFHLQGVAEDIHRASGFYSPPVLPAKDDLIEMGRFRDRMPSLIAAWHDFDKTDNAIFNVTCHALLLVVDALPRSAAAREDNDGLAFEIPALDLLDDPFYVADELLGTFFYDEFHSTAVHDIPRLTIMRNFGALIASLGAKEGSITNLTQVRGKVSLAQAAGIAFKDTPLEGIFSFSLGLPLPSDSRFKHQYVLGKTGSGKSVLLRNQIAHDIRAGHGLVVMTPERGLLDDALSYVPPERYGDVVYFDAAEDVEPVVGFNPFALPDTSALTQKAGELEAILIRTLGEMGVKMRPVVSNTVYALLAMKGSFADIPKLLDPDDATYRHSVRHLFDERTREFFDKYDGSRYYKDVYEPIINRLDTLLRPPLSRTLTMPSLNFSELLNKRSSIVLCDMSRLRGFQAEVTGQLLLSTFQQTFFQRDLVPESQRLPYFFYMDEFQTYATSSEASLKDFLTRARKYKTGIVMAHQNIKDIPEGLRASIFGNCGTLCGMLMSADDARVFAKESQLANFGDASDSNAARAATQLQNFKPGQIALTTPEMKKARIVRVPEFPPFERDFDALDEIKRQSQAQHSAMPGSEASTDRPSEPHTPAEKAPGGWDDLGYEIR